MKTKGISFWEQHIERFILGLALLVCLVFVAMQFMGEPNAVQIAGKDVSPGEVDELLIARAKEVGDKMDGTTSVAVEKVAEPVLPRFVSRLETPVAPASTLATWSPKLGMGGGSTTGRDRPFVTPQVPQPTNIAVAQHFDTILPEIVEGTEGLKSLIGANAPYDVTWNTIGAKIDVASLLQQYSTEGPNKEAPLLAAWYNNRVDFIDLKVEREEYVNGQWVNPTLIQPLPGYHSFRVELKDQTIDDALRVRVLSDAAEPSIRQQIIQPAFYGTMTESWIPPGGRKTEGPRAIAPDDPAAEEKAERDEIQARLDAVIAALKKLGCPDSPPPPVEPPPKEPKAPKAAGGGGAAPPGGDLAAGSGGGSGGLRGGGGGGQVDLGKCKSGWNKRRTLERQLAQLDEKIAKLSGQAAAKPNVVVEANDEQETIIDIWAHDLSITPGKTYRYRMIVEVYNPLFGRKPALIAAQQPLAEQFTMSSQPSDWSEATTAQPPLRLFVTGANPANSSSMGMITGMATAEVFRFHNGRWWFQRFPVTPGDRVGDSKADRSGPAVDYGTDWFVLDIVPTLGADSNDEKSGYGAMVMLQSLSDPSKIEWRVPRTDAGNPDRRRLMGRVKLAELGGEVASSDGDGQATAGDRAN